MNRNRPRCREDIGPEIPGRPGSATATTVKLIEDTNKANPAVTKVK